MLNFKNCRTAQLTTLQVGPLSITISTPVMAGYRRMGTRNLNRCTKVSFGYVGPNDSDFVNGGREWERVTVAESVAAECSETIKYGAPAEGPVLVAA